MVGGPQVMQRTFTKAAPPIVSVDFTEFSTGIGSIIFYGGDTNATSSGVSGNTILSNNKFFSNNGTSALAATSDIDFDVVFDKKVTINGDSIINVPVYLRNTGGGAGDGYCTITATVRKVTVGAVESDLVSGTTISNASMAAATSDKSTLGTIKVNIPKTTFSEGETLRLTIAHSSVSGSANTAAIGYDPQGRTTLPSSPLSTWTTSTILSISIPMEIDI